jgi:uncharacterized protein (TIRG00374 family)
MSRVGRSIGFAVAAAAALYLLLARSYTDGNQLLEQLRDFPLRFLVLGLLLASLNYAIRFLKWQYYLGLLDIQLPLRHSLLIFLSGFALTVTPGKIGEVLKSYLLQKTHGIPIARSAPVILAERVTDLVSLLLLSLLGASSWMSASQRYFVAIGFGLCALLLMGLAWRQLAHGLLDLLLKLPPRRLTGSVVPRLRTFYDAAYVLLRPTPLLIAVALSTVSWFCECLAFYWVVRGASLASHAIPASLLLCTFILALMTVAGALAFVPGGLGVTEGGIAILLAQLGGMARPTAVAATLIIRVVTLWFAVLIGLVALFWFGRIEHVPVDLDRLQRRD